MTNDDVLLVTVTAVSKKGTDNYVCLYDDETQKIKQVRVKLGNADAKQQKLHQGWKKFKKVITKAEKSFKDGETLKAEELDPAYADLAKPTKLVKEVWLEQVAKQTPGIEGNFVTNNLTSSISLQKTVKNVNITGASQGYFKAKKLGMLAGRSLQDNDYKNFSRVIVIDQMVAKKLFETNGDALNQVVTIGNNDYRVIGVYKNKDTAIGSSGEIGTALVANI